MSTRTLNKTLAAIDAAIEILEEKRRQLNNQLSSSQIRKKALPSMLRFPANENCVTVATNRSKDWPPLQSSPEEGPPRSRRDATREILRHISRDE